MDCTCGGRQHGCRGSVHTASFMRRILAFSIRVLCNVGIRPEIPTAPPVRQVTMGALKFLVPVRALSWRSRQRSNNGNSRLKSRRNAFEMGLSKRPMNVAMRARAVPAQGLQVPIWRADSDWGGSYNHDSAAIIVKSRTGRQIIATNSAHVYANRVDWRGRRFVPEAGYLKYSLFEILRSQKKGDKSCLVFPGWVGFRRSNAKG